MSITIRFNPHNNWLTINIGKNQTWQGELEDVPFQYQHLLTSRPIGFERKSIKIKLKEVK